MILGRLGAMSSRWKKPVHRTGRRAEQDERDYQAAGFSVNLPLQLAVYSLDRNKEVSR